MSASVLMQGCTLNGIIVLDALNKLLAATLSMLGLNNPVLQL